jgi:hypothetical protein
LPDAVAVPLDGDGELLRRLQDARQPVGAGLGETDLPRLHRAVEGEAGADALAAVDQLAALRGQGLQVRSEARLAVEPHVGTSLVLGVGDRAGRPGERRGVLALGDEDHVAEAGRPLEAEVVALGDGDLARVEVGVEGHRRDALERLGRADRHLLGGGLRCGGRYQERRDPCGGDERTLIPHGREPRQRGPRPHQGNP